MMLGFRQRIKIPDQEKTEDECDSHLMFTTSLRQVSPVQVLLIAVSETIKQRLCYKYRSLSFLIFECMKNN
jgi:hypothetical protein